MRLVYQALGYLPLDMPSHLILTSQWAGHCDVQFTNGSMEVREGESLFELTQPGRALGPLPTRFQGMTLHQLPCPHLPSVSHLNFVGCFLSALKFMNSQRKSL